MKIRKALKLDFQALKDLDTVVPLDSTRPEHIDEWLEHDVVLVAELDNKIVGYGVYNHTFFRQGSVELLMIHSDYRGQKIGEHLLLALEELCDTPRLWVTTNMSNHPMQRLLNRLDYEPGGYIHSLESGDPELIFFKQMSQAE